jgi:1,4-alpha-glucan branching enzyme
MPTTNTGVEFSLFAPYNEAVSLKGSWDNWQEIPMTKGADGWWRVQIPLEDGDYEYRFKLKSRSFFIEGHDIEISDPRAPELTPTTFDNAVARVRNGRRVVHEYTFLNDHVRLPSNDQLVIYEMHVGDFTGGPGDETPTRGTFRDVTRKLPYLNALGVNAIELMPVNEFSGDRSWGYNPYSLFAIENTYGTPTDFARLIDDCHLQGIRVIMDVVFNHMTDEAPLTKIDYTYWFHKENPHPEGMRYGPDFNYEFCDDKLGIWPARQEVHDAVLYWMHNFHIDGFRVDATYLIANHDMLKFLHETVFKEAHDQEKPFYTIAENLPQDPSVCGPDGPLDAAWHENYYQQLNAIVLGQERLGRQPYDIDSLICVLEPQCEGFGGPINVVNYIDNHDKDRLMWELGRHASIFDEAAFRRMKLGFSLLMTSPGIPMLWMGDEFGEAAPKTLDWQRIDWSLLYYKQNEFLKEYVKGLIKLRTYTPALQHNRMEVIGKDGDRGLLAFKRWDDRGGLVVVVVNLKDQYAGNFTFDWPENGRWHEYLYDYDVNIENNSLTDTLAESEVKIYLKQR